jgi:hypothetical protein
MGISQLSVWSIEGLAVNFAPKIFSEDAVISGLRAEN